VACCGGCLNSNPKNMTRTHLLHALTLITRSVVADRHWKPLLPSVTNPSDCKAHTSDAGEARISRDGAKQADAHAHPRALMARLTVPAPPSKIPLYVVSADIATRQEHRGGCFVLCIAIFAKALSSPAHRCGVAAASTALHGCSSHSVIATCGVADHGGSGRGSSSSSSSRRQGETTFPFEGMPANITLLAALSQWFCQLAATHRLRVSGVCA
jgi:hypothetical protein